MLYGSDTSYTSSVNVLVVNKYILLVAVCWYGINCSRDGDHQVRMGNCELSSKLWTVKYWQGRLQTVIQQVVQNLEMQ